MSFSEWKTYKLSEVINLIGGGTPKTSVSEYWNGDIPWLSVVDFGNKGKYVYETEKSITEKGLKESSTKILKKGEIIISARGTVGELAVLGREMAFNQSCYGVTAKDLTENDFLYYLLKFNIRQLKQNTHGSVFDTLTRQSFESIEVEIPDLKTQQRIASILSSLDDAIELNQQINKTLEEMAKAIFKEWFVDFNFPNATGKFQETEIGKIPVGWKSMKLNEALEIKYGKDHKHLLDGEFPVYGSGGIMRYAEKPLYESESILIPRKGTLSNLFYINKPFWTVDTMFYSKIKIKNSGKYLFHLLQTLNLASMNVGSAVPSLTTEVLNNIQIAMPDENTLKEFEKIVSSLFNQAEQNIEENQSLTNLRDTLLPKMMKGEIEINSKADVAKV